jgi:pimeloyl-ACP methyl ester carboxylesterase
MRKKWLVGFAVVVVILVVVYSIPFQQNDYTATYPRQALDLLGQIRQLPVKELRVDNQKWIYLSTGQGDTTLLFLHGMGGWYDIWFQQIDYFQSRYRVISVAYPPVHAMHQLANGVVAVLDAEGVRQAVVIGSSMGGYLAQYLAAYYPQRVAKVSLGNTFPPNNEIQRTNGPLVKLLTFLPEWLVMKQMHRQYSQVVIPASGNAPVAKAFLLSLLGDKVTKETLLARYHCITDYFDNPIPDSIPVQVIESDNDPLITPSLREALKQRYKQAKVVTLHQQGHFPYLSHPLQYNQVLEDFIRNAN